ncbi:polygalacturonase QRT3-like, partial [Phalaenopsis equestris]|uniref:polygalacturonase QRT3-like n=1 Tax=Phalaenopsis equestris TaxID=78828 RepID=UPI0009E4BB13
MAERRRGSPAHLQLGLIVFFSFAGVEAHYQLSGVLHPTHSLALLRSERLLASIAAGAAPSPTSSSSSSRVYHLTEYGADPTGKTDSTAAIARALSDAFRLPSNRSLYAGIADLGGAEIHLDGGSYLISSPITLPSSPAGNLKIHSGSLLASDDFPTNRYLIELWSSTSTSSSAYSYEYITLAGLLLDGNYRSGGIAVVDSLRTLIDGCYIVHFSTDGIWIKDGHETFITNSFLGQHITAGSDPGERNFSGNAIRLFANDNTVADVVIFSAAIGILVAGQA